jgi:hypothetical protein
MVMDDIKSVLRHQFGVNVLLNDDAKNTETSRPYIPEEVEDRPNILIRPADANDAAFILETWLDGHAKQNRNQSSISLFKMHRPLVENLLETSFTYVACNQALTDQIYGYVCAKRHEFDVLNKKRSLLIVHWAHVKSVFRTMGMASTILERVYGYRRGEKVLHTHQGRIIKDLKRGHNLEYAPKCQTADGIDDFITHFTAERIKHYGGHHANKRNTSKTRRQRSPVTSNTQARVESKPGASGGG